MSSPENDIRFFRFHILGIGCEKLLTVTVTVHIDTACQLHKVAHITAFRRHNIRAGKPHKHQYGRGFFPFVLAAIFFHKLLVFFNQSLRLFFTPELFAQSFNRGVHTFHTAQIQEQGIYANRSIFRLQIALQAVGGKHIVRIQRFKDFQIRAHSSSDSGHILIPFGNRAEG